MAIAKPASTLNLACPSCGAALSIKIDPQTGKPITSTLSAKDSGTNPL